MQHSNQDKTKENLLTVEETAAYLRLDVRTVYRYIKKGLPAHRINGSGRYRFYESEIDSWVKG